MDIQKCSTCKESKPVAEFPRNKAKPSGYSADCKDCRKGYMKGYREKHGEEMKAYGAAYREAHTAEKQAYMKEYMKTYYPANKDRMNAQNRRAWLQRENGLTQEQYETMLIAQEFGCAICGAPEPGGQGRFHVDHDHKTGQTRGLLCWHCNRGLGAFQDDPDRLALAAIYLSSHAAQQEAS
jgi:Recombination endonuclease VII